MDGSDQNVALTDGLLTLRYLFGLEGSDLIDGVVAKKFNQNHGRSDTSSFRYFSPLT